MDTQQFTPPVEPKNHNTVNVVGMIVLGLIILLIASVAVMKVTNKGQSSSEPPKASAVTAQGKVSMTATGFEPATIAIKKGQTITWTNTDSDPHQVASDPYPTEDTTPGLNQKSAVLKNGSFSYTFDKAGTYTYHDHINPLTLKGTVVVE